jgi:hypothetical protein
MPQPGVGFAETAFAGVDAAGAAEATGAGGLPAPGATASALGTVDGGSRFGVVQALANTRSARSR